MFPTLNPATAGNGLNLPEFVALAGRHGFTGVEFNVHAAHELIETLGLHRAAAPFEENKVLPAVFGLPVEWRKDEDTFRAGLEMLPTLAKSAQDLDCTRCCTWVLPSDARPVSQYAATSLARFVEIAKILADNGVRFGLEFIGPHHFRTDPNNVWFYDIPGALNVVAEIHEQAGVRNCGLLVDCFHWHTSGATAMDLASIPLEQIIHVHINDAPANLAREEIQDQIRELPGATGTIDVVGFLSTLNALGYDGPVAVETFSERLRGLSPDEAAAEAGQSVAACFQAASVKPLRLL